MKKNISDVTTVKDTWYRCWSANTKNALKPIANFIANVLFVPVMLMVVWLFLSAIER